MEYENDLDSEMECGFVERNDCAVVDAVVEFLNGTFPKQPPEMRPEKVVASHFVNPLRSLAAVRRFADAESGCEIFRTPDAPNSEWCVLESNQAEAKKAAQRINHEDPPDGNESWRYTLSQPSEKGAWHHWFRLVRNAGRKTPFADLDAFESFNCLRTSCVEASPDWQPSKSGVLYLLRDVSMSDTICRYVPRTELLLGLASHLAGKTAEQIPGFGRNVGDRGAATIQCSPSGFLYFVYSVCNLGPTHIFSKREQ